MPQLKENEIAIFNKLSSDLQIEKFQNTISKDTLFNQSFLSQSSKENEPYRVLKTPVSVNEKPYTFSARINLVDNSELAISIMGFAHIHHLLNNWTFHYYQKIIQNTLETILRNIATY